MKRLIKHLVETKALINHSNTLRICLGNTSTDLDSCVGSILLSYFLTNAQRGDYSPFVPVINGSLSKLMTCKTLIHHFQSSNIPLSSLVFYDELMEATKSKANKLEVILYDHNELDPIQGHLEPYVNSIYDHHVDLGKYPSAKRVISPCASAVSILLSQPFYTKNQMDYELGKFALAPILIDARNFLPKLQNVRWNDIDKRAYDSLNGILAPEGFNANSYYDELEGIENDTAEILAQGPKNLLERDYKNYKAKDAEGRDLIFGVASLNVSLQDFLKHFNPIHLSEQFTSLIRENELKYLIVLGRACETQRDFLLFTEDTNYLQKWNKEFEEQHKNTLELQRIEHSHITPQYLCYGYRNLELTRKGLEPLWRNTSAKL